MALSPRALAHRGVGFGPRVLAHAGWWHVEQDQPGAATLGGGRHEAEQARRVREWWQRYEEDSARGVQPAAQPVQSARPARAEPGRGKHPADPAVIAAPVAPIAIAAPADVFSDEDMDLVMALLALET